MNSQALKALKAYEKTEHIELTEEVCDRCGFPLEDHGPLSDRCPNYVGDLKLGYKEHSSFEEKVDCFLNEVCI